MHTLTVKLKQHTPLIHFQHDQDGATLRASEVKPKLDKFILTKLGEGDYEKGKAEAKVKGWLVGKGDHPALDYKMRIETGGEPKEFLVASLLTPNRIFDNHNREIRENSLPFKILKSTPFFAQESINTGTKPEESPVFLKKKNEQGKYDFYYNEDNWDKIGKKGLMWENVYVSFSAINQSLLEFIDSYLTDFFICTNFGTRSNKGFGSYTRICDESTVLSSLKNNYKFVYKKNKSSCSLDEIFRTIKEDYQKIKSGINHGNYTKSILFCYAVKKMSKNPRWEKRFFKIAVKDKLNYNQRLLDKHHAPICDCNGNSSWIDSQSFDYKYIRALLGMAEQYEFILEYQFNGVWKRDNKNKLSVKPHIKDVERCESPILIKIIDNHIYIVGNDINNDLLKKKVTIDFSVGKKDIRVSENKKIIWTPDDFDLSDFMNFAMGTEFSLGYIKEK